MKIYLAKLVCFLNKDVIPEKVPEVLLVLTIPLWLPFALWWMLSDWAEETLENRREYSVVLKGSDG